MSRVAAGNVDDFFRRAFGHNFPTTRATFRAEVNDPIRRFDHIQIVLDDDEHNLDVIKTADWIIDLGRKVARVVEKLWPKARRKNRPTFPAATRDII